MYILNTLLKIIKEKEDHFLSVDFKTYKRYKYFIKMALFFNKNYKPCEIKRRKFKKLRNFVVIALKYTGKNVKRRTSGYAKTFIENHTDSSCLYCGVKLNKNNATTDHIIPISKGGNNCQVNFIVVCNNCNSERGDIEFKKYLSLKNINYKSIKFI